MKVWPVKHSPLLRQPERFIARDELKSLIQKVTHNLVNIHDKTGEFLLRLDDGRVIDTKGWAGWEWTHGVGLYGIWQYYCQTGDEGMREIIDSWFADRFAEGATTKNVNTMSPFLTLAYRYEETKNPAWLPWLESWAEWAMNEMPRTEHGGMQHITLAEENHQQMWDDTLMMTVLPLAKIGKLLNKPEYVEGGDLSVPAPRTESDGSGDRAVVPRLELRRQSQLCPGPLGARQQLADHRDPGFPRAGGSAGKQRRSSLSGAGTERADRRTGKMSGRERIVAYAAGRS